MFSSNIISARFAAQPSLIGEGMSERFSMCATMAAQHPDFSKLMNATAYNDDGFWPAADDWMARYRPYVVVDGTLQIPVKGILLHDFPFTIGSWLTGYDYIWRAFDRGMTDGNVKRIALIIDSPGGEVAGCFECVDKMFAHRGDKPIQSFAAEYAYSAAYAIASVGDTINASRTGGVGSIGVVTAHTDLSAAYDQRGIKITFIHFGKHKVDGNSTEPLPDNVKARIQSRIDELGGIFVATVARNRSMDAATVKATEAQTYTASEAVSNGLADSIGALDDALAAFTAADLSSSDGDEEMSNNKDESVDKAAHENAVNAADAAGFERGKATGLTEGATNERARISAILGSDEGKARPVAAMNVAMETDMPVDKASAFLAKMPEEGKSDAGGSAQGQSTFEQHMNNSESPNLGQQGDEKPAVDSADATLSLAKSYGLAGLSN